MKPILVFLLTTALTFSAKGYAQDTIYRQRGVLRENTLLDFPLVRKNGVIVLTQDLVIFDCKKKNGVFSFSLAYKDIKNVRRYSYLWTFPIIALFCLEELSHGIKIETKNGDYYLSTFRRKKIMEIIKAKIAK